MAPMNKNFRLVKRTTCLRLTWGARLLLLGFLILLALFALHRIAPFLSYHAPIQNPQAFIIEGWLPDDALKEAISYIQNDSTSIIILTGGPFEKGKLISNYNNYAALTYASMMELGMDSSRLKSIPAPPVKRDRTYHAALQVGKWLKTHPQIIRVNLISAGVHSRRSTLLYQEALPQSVSLGTICLTDPTYDWKHWWRTSKGFRQVSNEALAYIYIKVRPPTVDKNNSAKHE